MADAGLALLGRSAAMERLRRVLPKIGRSDAPALITGSTGTGKECFARSVHVAGSRANRPFVAVNCGAIPETLFESELFGFERGSFTGAFKGQKGKALLADGGTLFLDEIGELSLHCQTKLLRMIEEREVHPIGASKPTRVNLRVIAATNRNVEEAVDCGGFRRDLYYRINVARIDMPDLCERQEDIPVLLDHFVEQFNARNHLRVEGVDSSLSMLLLKYSWPGNVRELRNFVEAVFIDPPDGLIRIEDIPPAFAHLHALYTCSGEVERARIISVLEQTHWNKAEAARSLHWSRVTLYRKLSRYGIGGVEN